jgi:hypothetical protein
MAPGSKVRDFAWFTACEQAFQRLKKASENQQKTGLGGADSIAMRLPEAFLAQSLDFKGLPKPGCCAQQLMKRSANCKNKQKYFFACRIKGTRENTDLAI